MGSKTASRIAIAATLGLGLLAPATSRLDARSSLPTKTVPPATLGVSFGPGVSARPHASLAWFDPLTLEVLAGRKAPLGGHVGSWAFSADRATLAIASCWDETGDAT